MRLLAIPFRFGKAAGDILSRKMRDFYLATARMAFTDASLSEDDETPITIPLSFDMVLDSGLIFKVVEEKVSAADHPYVIIDLSRPSEFVLTTHHVIAGILRAVTNDIKQGHRRRFLLLLSTMLARDDVVMLALAPLVDSGVLAIIADNGDSIGLEDLTPADSLAHCRRVTSINIPRIDLLQKKLIRFPGHFTISSGRAGAACTNFYFDGSLCQRELVELIDEFVAHHYASLENLQVLYDSVVSRWCETAVLAYCERRNLISWNMSATALDRGFTGLTRVLLILPLVDTGHTARELVSTIRAASPSAEITILAILSTQGNARQNGVIPPSQSTGSVPIHFFRKVMRAQYPPTQCPLCHAGIPKSDPLHPDPYTRLSSQAFWALATDVGFEDERDVPPYRPPLGQVPRFRSLEAENGAFLAYKFEKLLRAAGNLPVDPVVICPMEDGAQAIADCLEAVFNMTVIRVPKPVLDLHASSMDRNSIRPGFGTERWEVQIGTLINYRERIRARGPVFGRQQSNVIIMDELNVSDTTRNNLMRFAGNYGLEVLCCVSVMDFSGAQHALSLYDVNVPLRLVGRS